MDTDVSTSSPATRSPNRIARRRELDTGPTTTITSMFPAEPPPPPPPAPREPTGPVPVVAPGPGPAGSRGVVPVLLAAAVVLALAASVGVGVLWSANRKLAAEVEAAVAQVTTTQRQLTDLRATTPEAGAFDDLTGRVQDVEAWTGLPEGGQGRAKDLQSRLKGVAADTERLEDEVGTGLAGLRTSLTALEHEVDGAGDGLTDDDLEGLRSQVDDLRSDVATLCWALAYQPEVAASC